MSDIVTEDMSHNSQKRDIESRADFVPASCFVRRLDGQCAAYESRPQCPCALYYEYRTTDERSTRSGQ